MAEYDEHIGIMRGQTLDSHEKRYSSKVNSSWPLVWTGLQARGFFMPGEHAMHCPYCGYPFDHHLCLNEKKAMAPAPKHRTPIPGSVCLCAACFRISIIGNDMNPRAITPAEEFNVWCEEPIAGSLAYTIAVMRQSRKGE